MRPTRPLVPRFFLYGEAPAKADERFIHAETLERRSRPSGWKIAPHAHPDLNHVLVMGKGSGAMLAGGRAHGFTAPALLLVPAGEVHGFDFGPESQGFVITFVDPLLHALARREAGLENLFSAARTVPLPANDTLCLPLATALEAEMEEQRPGRELMVEGLLTTLLLASLRAARLVEGAAGAAARGPRVTLVARYRELLATHFRDGWSVADYAAALGATPGRLRAACLEVTGRAPIDLLHERLLAEAKHSLLYGDLPVAEVAFELGFTDPAYFNRFFTSRIGCSPGRFRRGAGG
ncbi:MULTISPECIES: helix-turn-helix domain-containing protein [unclassified Azospirillum]|uniref:helix-turn-helix domain-containing protein n=1 Tax=unclassified Azospirillum TaxID=2630922 RepID=UPI000B67C102|nr:MULTISPECIES: helix-turn-helix domain-containing protein [unclassified Azospirillum]SNS80160.1 transcriptional regulator, AraC family [Azospirillum sp. RU38E]SNS97420.1 transcriptional regulator, AraC family [Azospirillum sp. RU37A]